MPLIDINSIKKIQGGSPHQGVFAGRHQDIGVVAVKRFRGPNSAASAKAEFEIQTLCKGTGVVDAIGIASPGGVDNASLMFLVMQWFDSTLRHLFDSQGGQPLPPAQAKSILRLLLAAVSHIHSRGVVHRDIKPTNILLSDGTLAVGDFGSARLVDTPRPCTPDMVTLWYRAPEILLGASAYDYAVDIWSVGCVGAELFLGMPLSPGASVLSQVEFMLRSTGSSPVYEALPLFQQHGFTCVPQGDLGARLKAANAPSVCAPCSLSHQTGNV